MLLLPWQPWRNRETLQVIKPTIDTDLSDISVVIPARNEALQISETLNALAQQGINLQVIVVDDQSQDGTAELVRRFQGLNTTVIEGQDLPKGWTGKLWALQQGYAKVKRPVTVLLDADITLAPGVLVGLREKLQRDNISFLSVMAHLSMSTFWEKLLLPAFVYFFKQLYPFALSNDPRVKFIAAAAGGCIMVKTDALNSIGGFASIKDSLIDDCALAKRMKQNGHSTWVGLTRDVQSHRPYGGLKPIWEMVSRTAFHQLKYSGSLLLTMTLIFLTIYVLPWTGLFTSNLVVQTVSILALIIMMGIYLPILRYYQLNPSWCLAIPLIALLYLSMTWYSAIEYWFGTGNSWRGRHYGKHSEVEKWTG
jgi:hopene-associated glycosyltransferase HpnB